MIDKIKFIGTVVFFVGIAYIILTISMPLISQSAEDAATTINASAYASNYEVTRAGNSFMPLVLYFIPGAIGITAIVIKIRQGDKA